MLTARQREMLEQIERLILERGYAPTLRELCAAMHIESTNGVSEHLVALERKGYIVRDAKVARSIRVVKKP